jgi:hypothetical protein
MQAFQTIQTGKNSMTIGINAELPVTISRNAADEGINTIILSTKGGLEPWVQEICETLLSGEQILISDFWMPAEKLAKAIYSVYLMDGFVPTGSVEQFVEKYFPKELRTKDHDNFLLAE